LGKIANLALRHPSTSASPKRLIAARRLVRDRSDPREHASAFGPTKADGRRRTMVESPDTMLIWSMPEDLCLNYANTLSWRGSDKPVEMLHDFADILRWSERCGVVRPTATQRLRRWSRHQEAAAAELFAQAIVIREAMFRIFSAIAVGASIPNRDFVVLSAALANAPGRHQLARSGERCGWRVEAGEPSVARVLAPVLWSAGDLMLHAPSRPIRRCANEECLWLFIDQSKNSTRRWCDMNSCGNRAKARRHYAKVRQR
jgi:predicted RNA-binding Zn ribbon-like protein